MKKLIFLLGCAAGFQVQAKVLFHPMELDGFRANQVSVLSDGDAYAQSYLGLELTPFDNALFQDQISHFYRAKGKLQQSQVPVSNSVNGTPEVLSFSPDGTLALVVETKKQKSREDRVLGDLEDGNQLTLIDTKNPSALKIIQIVELDFTPLSVDFDSTGEWAAVGGHRAGKGIVAIVHLEGREIAKLNSFEMSDVTEFAPHPMGAKNAPDTVSLVQWHPSEHTIAIHFFRRNQVAFFSVDRSGEAIRQWKNSVATGPDPFVGRFSASGEWYVTANWDRNFSAKTIYERLPKGNSTLSLIQISKGEAPHQVVQTVETASSPEGIAFSQVGSLVATVSMKHSLYSVTRSEFRNESTLTLFRFVDGRLVRVAKKNFQGLLPEGGAFDLSGNYFLATVFQDSKLESKYGLLKVFEIGSVKNDAEKWELQEVGEIQVPHGPHHVVVR